MINLRFAFGLKGNNWLNTWVDVLKVRIGKKSTNLHNQCNQKIKLRWCVLLSFYKSEIQIGWAFMMHLSCPRLCLCPRACKRAHTHTQTQSLVIQWDGVVTTLMMAAVGHRRAPWRMWVC